MAPQEEPHASAPLPPPIPETTAAAEEPRMGEFARISAVFSSPSVAFRDIARRPTWWVPVILLAVLGTIFTIAFGSRVGFERVVRQQLESSPQAANLSPAQIENAVRVGARVAQFFQYGGAVVSILIAVLAIAAVLKFLFDTLMGADIGFKRMMAIVAYAQLPTLISTALSLLVLNLKPPDDFNIQNPLAFNVGAYLSTDTPLWVRSLGASFDLFSFWIMILLAIGVSTVGRRISFSKAFLTILFPWALYVLLKVGAVAIRG